MTPDSVLDQVADAILDGMPIDWSAVDAQVASMEKALVESLKTLAALRRTARVSDAPEPSGTWNWGHLRVSERIGRGAYGDVYRAWDTRLDREVALKLLPADALGTEREGSTVIEEGRLLARVRHPNVVTIYGAERIDGRVGLWMELVKGRTLEEALRTGRLFSAAEVTRLGVELCSAVSAVHAAGLLHRDIKLQNVMLDDNGRLVLMDFGTGRESEDATDQQMAGTPLYLAPEVLSGQAATRQNDVYSLGVVLFRLLTNSYPVTGVDLADLRHAHTAAAAAGGARFGRAAIPGRLRRVLIRAMDPNRARRYANAEAFGAALAATERTPIVKRVAYVLGATAALVAALAGGWNLGLRELVMRASASTGLAKGTPAIAVLPFRNAGSDPDNDYFVDGLTSEVIRNLSTVDGLQVRSQTSSFYFKDRPLDLREVAAHLKVDYVVEATVQRVGNRLHLDAQLVPVPDNAAVWTESFDRTINDVFAIQDEISRAIVNKLRLTLGRGQRRPQTNLTAYDLYLRGRAKVARRGTESAKEASQLFEQVIAIDPNYAPAYAGLADAYAAMFWQFTSGVPPAEALAKGKPAAIKALELDPGSAEAHAAMGVILARELRWDDAATAFDRALELDPTLSLSQIRTNYVDSTLLPQGNVLKALDILAGAVKADPMSLEVRREVAMTQMVRGQYEEAVSNLRQVIAVDPEFPFAANSLARALTFAGRPEEAIAVWESRQWPGNWERWVMQAYVKAGRRADVDRLVEAHRNENPYRQALIFAALGDKDRTFEMLNRAVDDAPQRTASLLVDPEMAFLRGDPRLERLRARLNLR